MNTTRVLVNKEDLSHCRTETRRGDLLSGQVMLRIDAFGLSTNNITYAVYGDRMRYWDFFPAGEGWGVVPVWGFGTVERSELDSVCVGTRFYGFFPMADRVALEPSDIGPGGFLDGRAHRQPLPHGYNIYGAVTADPKYNAAHEAVHMLIHPLFTTSFLIDAFLAENDFFRADQIILSSASSKTALATAYCLSRRAQERPRIVGLTSARNSLFCRTYGHYDDVLTYDEVGELSDGIASIYVDFAGIGPLLKTIHHHFQDNLKHSCIVGTTHWRETSAQHSLPGPKPRFFFAPDHLEHKRQVWGAAEYARREGEHWHGYVASASQWLQIEHANDPDAVQAAYLSLLRGGVAPQSGIVCSMNSTVPM